MLKKYFQNHKRYTLSLETVTKYHSLYLSKKGFDIETIITYHTKEVEQNMEVNYDGIIFKS
jgi:hypothetical protein